MRINILGGPGSGKSTTAAWLFSELKLRNVSVELVNEYVKAKAYARHDISKWDQVYILGKQMQYEYRFLKHGVKNVITDSPCLLSYFYTNDEELADPIAQIIYQYELDFPSINLFLDRGDKEYIQEGRYQSKEDAMKVDTNLWTILGECMQYSPIDGESLRKFHYLDRTAMLDYVINAIDK